MYTVRGSVHQISGTRCAARVSCHTYYEVSDIKEEEKNGAWAGKRVSSNILWQSERSKVIADCIRVSSQTASFLSKLRSNTVNKSQIDTRKKADKRRPMNRGEQTDRGTDEKVLTERMSMSENYLCCSVSRKVFSSWPAKQWFGFWKKKFIWK